MNSEKLSNIGFIITAYKQKELVIENIKRIKSYKLFDNPKIIVVSTSEVDIGFEEIEQYENVYFINFKDAPQMTSRAAKEFVQRIFFSIRLGLIKAKELNIEKVLHLHSDTYWDAEKENNLYNIFLDLNDYMVMCDICSSEDMYVGMGKKIHIHPEGIFLNIQECYKYGYGFNFDKIWNSNFNSINMASPEELLGTYAIYCLSNEVITNFNTEIPQIYYDKIKFLMTREYHGIFDSGLCNIQTDNN
jgi:hypothetical protein